MKRGASLLILLGIIGQAHAESTRSGSAMIPVGTHHRGYVKAATPGTWFAICPTRAGVELKSTNVTVDVVPYDLGDFGEGDASEGGRRITAAECGDAIVLLRHSGLTAGPLPTAFLGRAAIPVLPGIELLLGSTGYQLTTDEVHDKPGSIDVSLRSGRATQRIARRDGCCNDARPSVVWAGDLDRDGKLDLLLDLTTHYAASDLVLFLSSAATGAEMVAEVAEHKGGGC